MPTYKLTIAYDGTDFAGWQKQEPPDPAAHPEQRAQRVAINKLEAGLEAGRPGRIALRTVQAVVERAVREVVREPVLVQGASRTDAGVHARCQVGVFRCGGGTEGEARDEETERRRDEVGEESDGAMERRSDEGGGHGSESRATGGWPVERGVDRLLRAVNSRLPRDVQVVAAEVVRDGFDPIGDCVAKGYSYSFWASPHRALWERRTVWHTWSGLDVAAMREAARWFVGVHDFAAFAAAGHGRASTVREVFACEVWEETERRRDGETEWGERGHGGTEARRHEGGGTHGSESRATLNRAVVEPGRLVRMEISGSGFLYNMVRIIAGTLHEVGRGHIAAGDVPGIIAGLDRRRAGPTLPPEGLCLEWIRYREAEGC
jgi:tRNA pseudouridine38-40 synthase